MANKLTFKEALESLKDAVCDLTSLEVQTYVGNLDVAVQDQAGTTDFEKILEKVKADGNLKLVAVTKINFDGDGLVLVPEAPTPEHVLKAHAAALKAGQQVREALLTLFADVTGLTISKS